MPDLTEPTSFRFDEFLVDKQAGALLRFHPDGQATPVQIGSRAFQLLCLLVERRGGIVSRQEIMDDIWPNIAVEENNLSVQLSALRRALDTDGARSSCIQTIPGRGYRFLRPMVQTSPPLV